MGFRIKILRNFIKEQFRSFHATSYNHCIEIEKHLSETKNFLWCFIISISCSFGRSQKIAKKPSLTRLGVEIFNDLRTGQSLQQRWRLRRVSPEFLEQLSGRQKSQHRTSSHRRRRATKDERRSPLVKYRIYKNDDDFKFELFRKFLKIDKNEAKWFCLGSNLHGSSSCQNCSISPSIFISSGVFYYGASIHE